MSFRAFLVRLGRRLAVAGISVQMFSCALAQDRLGPGTPALPDLGRREISTNANPLARKDGLRALEQELNRSFLSLAPKSSLDGVLAPSPQYPAPPKPAAPPNKRALELLQRQKGWGSLSAEDMATLMINPNGSSGSASHDPNGKRTGTGAASDLERFLGRGIDPASVMDGDLFGTAKKPVLPKAGGPDANSGMPGELKTRVDGLRKMMDQDRTERLVASPDANSSGLFGLIQREPTLDEIKARKDRMDDYRKWLNEPVQAPSAMPEPLADQRTQPANPGLSQFSATPHSGLFETPTTSVLPIIRDPTLLQDPNATVLNQWNPLYVAPKLEPAPVTPPAPPLPEAPRRKF